MHILVTGAAGFIGYHLCDRLLAQGHTVVGLDNLNDYYDVQLKKDRLAQLEGRPGFRFVLQDMAEREAMSALFAAEKFTHVINMAAQAGVRYSLINPMAYVDSNLVGFANLLEGCRHNGVQHFVFASSSSVYGLNTSQPFSEHNNVDHPVSLYAATKKSNELMAHSYSHLYGLPCTGLRFFTVYGPWGRPDMALQLFAHAIMKDEPIKVFNGGRMRRDGLRGEENDEHTDTGRLCRGGLVRPNAGRKGAHVRQAGRNVYLQLLSFCDAGGREHKAYLLLREHCRPRRHRRDRLPPRHTG